MQRHEDKKATQLVVGILAPNFKKELMQNLKTNVFSVIIDDKYSKVLNINCKILEKWLCSRYDFRFN
jgi:hypothetical protein